MKSLAAQVISQDIKVNFALISAARPGLSAQELAARHTKLKVALQACGLMAADVTGSYKGETKQSCLVLLGNFADLGYVIAIARQFEQESVLTSEAGVVSAVFPNNTGHQWDVIGHGFELGTGAEEAWTQTPCGRIYRVSNF